jgi:hypothetical protein
MLRVKDKLILFFIKKKGKSIAQGFSPGERGNAEIKRHGFSHI